MRRASPRVIQTVARFGYAFIASAALDRSRGGNEPEAPGRLYRLVWGRREIYLDPGDNLIGRDRDAVVWIDDESVSRRHARISEGPCPEVDRPAVQTDTVERPGGDAAVIRVKGTKKGIAMKSDVNPFFCMADPYRGGAIAVAEAARSVACVGARPLAITDCLNFGNPEKPEVMAQFEAAVRGIADACRALDVPVVSGNVSFYNETDGRAIPPTPTVGMVGLLDDVTRHVRLPFRRNGDLVALLGETRDELGASEFLRTIRGRDEGPCPEVDLPAEARLVNLLVALAAHEKLASAHDVSDGGLAVALAECAMQGNLGAVVELDSDLRPSALLFGESTGRAIVSVPPSSEAAVRTAAEQSRVPFRVIGTVGGDRLRVFVRGRVFIDEDLAALDRLWRSAFAHAIEAADVL
jgi:phosphoribosylformylglycinamidine synthase